MTLILASGHGLGSLLAWQSASGCVPELLQLDAAFALRRGSGTDASEFCAVSFQFQRNHSLWLLQALRNMNSAWRLTSWSIREGDSVYWATCGEAGAGAGVA